MRNNDKSIGRRLSEKEKREFLESLSDDRFVSIDARVFDCGDKPQDKEA